ncbi:tRNA (N(6)-L-threonylcarbamoyladenosine(37)-C(2))-methylthiotransferase [Candidatus Pacearchaeota archaeon]|nr:tRNA (N(6)-L-threonylcarbamoyladenosine(37)-C(2))-methylthiotransferase [Candidatus Pacearchaeota archaeon]
MEKVYIETYGCSANQNNSEILAGILSRAGFLIVNSEELADVVIINSCVVKSKTESKIKRRIQDLKSKNLVLVCGCMPETDFKKIRKLNTRAIFLGTHHFKEVLNLLRDYQEKKLDEKKQLEYLKRTDEIKLNLPKLPKNNLVSIHQISEGCLGNCSYCKTKLAKGKLFSYPIKDIVKSITQDLESGAKEIWLTSQDNGCYGCDWDNKSHLPELLNEILTIKRNFKLRLGMINPNHVNEILKELLEIYKNPKMYKFLHIPIQSASNQILEHMHRKYKIEQVREIINKFQKDFPDIVIATDIIVGYPRELEEDQKKNLDFIREFKPDVFNLSKFSKHKGTELEKYSILAGKIIAKRASELMQAHKETAKENKQKYINKTIKVFVNEKISENLYRARDENYNIVVVKTSKEDLGKEIEVRIINFGVHNLIGEKTKVKSA